MMSSVPQVSIVIPNWNGAHHLPTCLDALRAQTYPAIEVIVVDNASEDASRALLTDRYPEVRLLALPENRGFTGACNVGMSAARGAIIALLNNDTEAGASWVESVVAAFDRHPDAGLVASKMLLFDRRDRFHTAGDSYRVDGRLINRGVWERDIGQYDTEEYVFSACGGSAAYRRAMLDDIGLLDDDFFFSCEDMDLAWRAQLAGYRCIYAPNAVVYHRLSATGGGATASYYDGRNAIWLLVKNYPAALWRRHWRSVLRYQARLGLEAVRAWQGAAARARLRGMAGSLLGLPKMLRKRLRIQRSRRVSIDYLESILTPLPDAPAKHRK